MKSVYEKQQMNIVIAGHVDHGKSTIVGRLLADTGSLPQGKLEQVRESCKRNSKPFEYAFLIDALKDEQAQGITIDSARVFFKTDKRDYIIIDAPGHIEFLKNMVTGASRAEAALLVIDAEEGVQENSRRHGYMLSMLGIKKIAVLISKMDLVSYKQEIFDNITNNYRDFLTKIDIEPTCFIPVSGMAGDNIAGLNSNMPWYSGETVIETLDRFTKDEILLNKPLRMPVQDVYKFTRFGDKRRLIAGTIATGSIQRGDQLVFYPSGKKGRIASIEGFNRKPATTVQAGYATAFTLEEQIYITRGEIACKENEREPKVTTRLRVNLFWMSREPLIKKKDYLLKIGTAKITARVEEIIRIIDASDLSSAPQKERIERHDVAECIFKLNQAAAFDLTEEIVETGRFVIVDNFEIGGGGIIREALEDKQTWVRDKVFLRNYKWEKSIIAQEDRAERYNQKSTLILITGQKDTGKKTIAKKLEEHLFNNGRIVYFLGIGNVLYGVDADIKGKDNDRREHIRRLSEIAHILLDAGIILIVTAIELTQEDLELIKTALGPDKIETIWIGENITTDIVYDLHIDNIDNLDDTVGIIKERLQNQGIIFKP